MPSLGHINHFYRIADRDDELSRSSNGIIESWQCNDLALLTTWSSLRLLRTNVIIIIIIIIFIETRLQNTIGIIINKRTIMIY